MRNNIDLIAHNFRLDQKAFKAFVQDNQHVTKYAIEEENGIFILDRFRNL